jgi:hypothetical protein
VETSIATTSEDSGAAFTLSYLRDIVDAAGM